MHLGSGIVTVRCVWKNESVSEHKLVLYYIF